MDVVQVAAQIIVIANAVFLNPVQFERHSFRRSYFLSME
jgi:hypothetical protein